MSKPLTYGVPICQDLKGRRGAGTQRAQERADPNGQPPNSQQPQGQEQGPRNSHPCDGEARGPASQRPGLGHSRFVCLPGSPISPLPLRSIDQSRD